MDTAEIMMIGAVVFVVIALIITLIYMFQPQTMRESKLFKRRKKQTVQIHTTYGLNTAQTSETEIVVDSIDTLALKPIMNSYDLNSYNKLHQALKNKDVVIFPKILFSDFIAIQKIVANKNNEFYGVLPYLKADFLICKASNCRPICIVRDTKVPTENAYKAYMQKISEKLNINYLEVDGITDATIADIYRHIQ